MNAEPEYALRGRGLTKKFGSVVAVDSVDLAIRPGERRAVIGPNGAGKSTLFAVFAGTLAPSTGTIEFFGDDITRERDHARARRGLVKTFQHSSVFTSITVLDNVILATQRTLGWGARPVGGPSRRAVDAAQDALALAGLGDRADALAGELSHGERRQLEVALAISSNPRVLLLDEPTAGMSQSETDAFVRLIETLPAEIAILIIEHDLEVAFAIADRVSVMHLGAIVEEGSPDDIRASALVQEVYIGVDAQPAAEGGLA